MFVFKFHVIPSNLIEPASFILFELGIAALIFFQIAYEPSKVMFISEKVAFVVLYLVIASSVVAAVRTTLSMEVLRLPC